MPTPLPLMRPLLKANGPSARTIPVARSNVAFCRRQLEAVVFAKADRPGKLHVGVVLGDDGFTGGDDERASVAILGVDGDVVSCTVPSS